MQFNRKLIINIYTTPKVIIEISDAVKVGTKFSCIFAVFKLKTGNLADIFHGALFTTVSLH